MEFEKYFTNSQNVLQNPDLFGKLKPKPLQNLDFAKHFAKSRYLTFWILQNISQSPDI